MTKTLRSLMLQAWMGLLVSGLWMICSPASMASNHPPTARIDVDPERPNLLVYDGDYIFCDGSASSDNDEGGSSITYYEWYVNGDPRSVGPDRVTFSERIVLSEGSSQTVKLRVKDDEGTWGEKTITITVTTRPKRYYYLKDHLGSVRVTFNENGDVVHYDDYYPFGLQMPGRSMEEDGPKERFTGHEKDGETGLYYAGARFLDPVAGRWMSVDPHADVYPELSPYNYAFDNPMAWTDPTGKDPCDADGDGEIDSWCLDEIVVEALYEPGFIVYPIGDSVIDLVLDVVSRELSAEPTFGNRYYQVDGEWWIAEPEVKAIIGLPPDVGRAGGIRAITSVKGTLKYLRLPVKGKIRFVPPKSWKPGTPLRKGPNGGYIDRHGNEWVKGPSRTKGEPFEWDVQLSSQGKAQLGHLSSDGRHLNVSLEGRVTH